MMEIYGLANLNWEDYDYVAEMPQDNLLMGLTDYMAVASEAANNVLGLLVADTVTRESGKYDDYASLPQGSMTRTARGAMIEPVTTGGIWEWGAPLHSYKNSVVLSEETYAQMTPRAYANHVRLVAGRYANALRLEALAALFRNTSQTIDSEVGTATFTVYGLANNDATLYPPAYDDFDGQYRQLDAYAATGYAYSAVSTVNNPFVDVIEYFSGLSGDVLFAGGERKINMYANPRQTSLLTSLPGFVPVAPNGIQDPNNAYTTRTGEGGYGQFLGTYDGQVDLFALKETRSDYIWAVDMSQDKPLVKRVFEAPALGRGELITTMNQTENDIILSRAWQAHFGFGVRNRMNGFVMQYTAGSYTNPYIF